jgi:hypothetical protein
MSKITMAAAGAVGYLLGSRAGRGPYERFASEVQRLRNDPAVQQKAAEARDTVTSVATDAVEAAKARVDGVTAGPGTATP